MTDFILIAVLAGIIGFAARYVYKEKKRGAKCIGCPAAGTCRARQQNPNEGCGCGCGCGTDAQ